MAVAVNRLEILNVELGAVVFAVDEYRPTHLSQAASDAHADAVFQSLVYGRAPGVEEVGRDDGEPLPVVALANHVAEQVERPRSRLLGGQLVQEEDGRGDDRREDIHLARRRLLV